MGSSGSRRPGAFKFTPMAANQISFGSPRVTSRAPHGVHRACGEPNEIKKYPPKNITALFRAAQVADLERLVPDDVNGR